MHIQKSFWVSGTPQPKGSMIPLIHRHTKKAMLIDQNKKNYTIWKNLIRAASSKIKPATPLSHVPFMCYALFFFDRNQVIYQKGKPKTIYHPHSDMILKPDTDKCLRSVLDALTDWFWADDRCVVFASGRKRWVNQSHPTAGTKIFIKTLRSFSMQKTCLFRENNQ